MDDFNKTALTCARRAIEIDERENIQDISSYHFSQKKKIKKKILETKSTECTETFLTGLKAKHKESNSLKFYSKLKKSHTFLERGF